MGFLASLVGSGVGYAESQQAMNQANNNESAAVQQWLSLNVPDPAQQALYLQQYKQTGTLNPQLVQQMKLGPTAFQNIQTNPQLQQAQLQALQSLQNEGNLGGTSLEDQATEQQQLLQSNAAAKGRSGAIANQMGAQGLGGSGLELQAQLQNSQNANQTQAMTSLQAAANSRQRALQAVMGAGQLGGQMQQQQYGQQANLARAQDAINQFNTQNAQQINYTNTNAAIQAQQYNLGLQQQISNANTGLQNQQQAYNKGLYQQQFQNQMQKTQGAANAQMGYGNYLQGQAQNTQNMWAGIGSGVGKGITAYQQANNKSSDNSNSYAGQSGQDSGQGAGQMAGSGGGFNQYAGDDEDMFGGYA